MNNRRKLLVVVWAALTMTIAAAAEYPDRPIRFIVPIVAGSGPDINARLLAPELSNQMGQQVVVDNQPGAPGFQPQLILLDVMMPVMDGPATLKMLRGMPQFASTLVIVMTAKVQPSEVAGYKEIGPVDVIPKPFDPMTLSSHVQAIWERCHG